LPCVHPPLRSGEIIKIAPSGEIEWTTACRQVVSGSFDKNITVKSVGSAGNGLASGLFFSGNPSKFLQGHNIFGSDDLLALMSDTYDIVCSKLNLNPSLADIQAVRAGDYRLTRLDINHSFDLPCKSDVQAWLRASEYKSKSRHGRPSSKGGTVYWGKDSKRWVLVAYCKAEEVMQPKHRLPDSLADTPLIPWVDNKLRIELRLKSKELDKINLSAAKNCTPVALISTYLEYVKRLDMNEQIALSTEKLMKLPQRLRSTYVLWKDGHDLRSNMAKNTYYRHRKELMEYGINIDLRQDSTDRSNVVPLIRILEAMPASIPDWAFTQGLVHRSASKNPLRKVS
ncbi:phage/plasmid replication protein, II/X family, partial [Nocardia mangyaensis]|uniref:phage/plasmid replication protein, II/X family n=1 Tax=Nocardia mangyaensis TaxID=2213200 RepID=UPI002674F090